jgi:hypothetical protein
MKPKSFANSPKKTVKIMKKRVAFSVALSALLIIFSCKDKKKKKKKP